MQVHQILAETALWKREALSAGKSLSPMSLISPVSAVALKIKFINQQSEIFVHPIF